MIDAVWLQVLQRIPTDYYDALAVITVTGAELVIQQVFKVERDFMVIRARTAGTGDLGRTVIIAFSQIDFVAFNRKMTEEEVLAIFGEPMPEIALPQPPAVPSYSFVPPAIRTNPPPIPTAPLPPKPAPVAEDPQAASQPAPKDAPSMPKPGQISKTILLARLRERLAEKTR